MDIEVIYILIIPWTCLFWMLGGKYNKAIRRYGIPLIIYLPTMAILKIPLEKTFFTIVLTSASYHMGYGEDSPLRKKCITAASYSLSTLFLGTSIWQGTIPPIFLTTFFLSNYKPTAKVFTWKVCEAITGFFIGVMVAALLANLVR